MAVLPVSTDEANARYGLDQDVSTITMTTFIYYTIYGINIIQKELGKETKPQGKGTGQPTNTGGTRGGTTLKHKQKGGTIANNMNIDMNINMNIYLYLY